jgi:hypothetical protein
MKKLFTFISLVTISYFAQANYLTVDNTPGSIAMYTNLQNALDSASIGDTIFVVNSGINYYNFNSNYGDITIKKPVVLLGEGYRKTDLNVFSKPTIGSITIQTSYSPGINQTSLIGLMASSINGYLNKISNCLILGNVNISNATPNTSLLINYCRIYGQLTISGNSNFNSIVSNSLIGSSTKNVAILSSSYSIFRNNIIFGGLSACSNLTFQNNIIKTPAIGGSYDFYGTNISLIKNISEGGNLMNDNYSWDYTLFDTFGGVYDYSPNYPENSFKGQFSLSINSITKYIGTDGTEIGLYGGNYPWSKNKIDNGNIGLPIVKKFEIINTNIEKDQPLNVNLKISKGE